MNDLRITRHLKHSGFTAVLALTLASGMADRVFADLAVRHVEVAPLAAKSLVPAVTAKGRFLSPQAISAVDVSADGKFITVGTMAFSHDVNVWQFGPDGIAITQRHFPPWAPMQVATLTGGRALAVGLAYSRVTSPDPTVWFGSTEELFAATLRDEFAEGDSSDGQFARRMVRQSFGRIIRAGAGLGVQASWMAARQRGASARTALRAKESVAHQPSHAHGGEC
jgi:hypothetical protein